MATLTANFEGKPISVTPLPDRNGDNHWLVSLAGTGSGNVSYFTHSGDFYAAVQTTRKVKSRYFSTFANAARWAIRQHGLAPRRS